MKKEQIRIFRGGIIGGIAAGTLFLVVGQSNPFSRDVVQAYNTVSIKYETEETYGNTVTQLIENDIYPRLQTNTEMTLEWMAYGLTVLSGVSAGINITTLYNIHQEKKERQKILR